MRRAFILALSVLALAAVVVIAGSALAADYLHTDGSAAYIVPAGLIQVPDSRLKPNQARFDIDRPGLAKAGTCVLGVNLLPADANLETWATRKRTQLADPETMAKASVRAPMTFVRLGDYREMSLRGGGDGYVFWVTSRRADGREQTDLTAVGLIGTRHLYAATCSSEPGLNFTPAEIDRIRSLVASVRRP
jgi:hypothetical protein